MVRAGGSASRTISNNNTPDQDGGRRLVWNRPKDDNHGPRWIPDVQGFPVLGSLTPAEKDRCDCAVQNCAAVVDEDSEVDPLCRPEWGGSHQAPLGRFIKAPRRQMRPARNGGSTRRMTPTGRNDTGKNSSSRPTPARAQARSEQAGWKTKSDRPGGIMLTAVAKPPLPEVGGGGEGVMSTGGEDVMKISAVQPLSVEAVELSPAPATEEDRRPGGKTMSSGTGGSSPTKVVELPLSKAGGGGVKFTALAEVHRPPSTGDGGMFLAQASGQQVIGNTDPGKAPVMLSAPRGDTLANMPKLHSAPMEVLDGIPMEMK